MPERRRKRDIVAGFLVGAAIGSVGGVGMTSSDAHPVFGHFQAARAEGARWSKTAAGDVAVRLELRRRLAEAECAGDPACPTLTDVREERVPLAAVRPWALGHNDAQGGHVSRDALGTCTVVVEYGPDGGVWSTAEGTANCAVLDAIATRSRVIP